MTGNFVKMKNIEDKKKKLVGSNNPLNLIYEWVKTDKIAFSEFKELLSYLDEYNKKQMSYDFY